MFKRPKRCMLPDLAAPRQQSSTTPEYPTSKDQQQFFTTLKALMPKSAILSSLQPNPSCSAAPAPAIHRLPTTLMSLRHPKYRTMSKEDVNLECYRIFNEEIKITQEADYLEKSTKLQAQSLLWFAHRRGCITASKFSAVLHTSIASPSQSLVDSILAEKCFEAKSSSLEWGRVNEPVAGEEYLHIMQRTHTEFMVQAAGLFINPLYPHLGASPDGLVSCLCCGAGVIEIKCPYSLRNSDPSTAAETSHFYLEHGAEGIMLSRNHAYYLQVQGHLVICDKLYCDFICWTTQGIHIERIKRDIALWQEIQPKLDCFFVGVLLPNIICENIEGIAVYDGCNDMQLQAEANADKELYCICQREEEGLKILCDNEQCPYRWFHASCVGLDATCISQDKWYCTLCCN